MGLFDSLKKNFTHGGVDVTIKGPASASLADATLPVAVAVTAKDSAQQINKITVELIRESRNRAVGESETSSGSSDSLALSQNTEVFSLAVGETREVPISLVMSSGKAVNELLPEGSPLAGVANAFQQLQSVANALDANSYEYYLTATADVEGVALDPGARQSIQLLKPNEAGGAFRVGL